MKTERRLAKRGSVLVVDDEEIMREVLETLLATEGHRVDLAKTGEEGLEAYGRRAFDVVLLDVSMPGIGGLRALEEFLKMDPEAVIVMITAYATFDTAIAAWERGAFGCIRKPFQNEQITATVGAGIKRRRKEEERRSLRRAMSREVDRGEIVGRSDVMQEVFRLVEQVAPARSTVLITGESGTGKELIAKAIHEASPRVGKPFVTVNSSNIPSELLESELFGHTRGAFTGAVADKKGLFELADGGTLFLDEVGDMSLGMQQKLLRVLQEGEIRRVGGKDSIPVRVRIISASNKDLRAMVAEGTFRKDLYFRLNGIRIRVPSLRERKDDIPFLVRRFVEEAATRAGGRPRYFDVEALRALHAHDWPGNVRELRHFVERTLLTATGDTIRKQDLLMDWQDAARPGGPGSSLEPARKEGRPAGGFWKEYG